MKRPLPLLSALLLLALAACDSDDPSFVTIQDLAVQVDFDRSPAALQSLTTQTPTAYDVKICRLVLWNPGTDARFEVFAHATPAECPVFSFREGQSVAQDLVPEGVALPEEPGFVVAELDIASLEMEMDFHIDAAGEAQTRRMRIYYMTDGPYRPGDVAIVHDPPRGDNWAFGNGNLSGDAMLEGLPRAEAYTLETWPRGQSTAEWGPFGDAAFWQNHPPDPFTWAVALPVEQTDAATIVVRVADTWAYEDPTGNGLYDWPTDYTGCGQPTCAWHMEFPQIVGVTAP